MFYSDDQAGSQIQVIQLFDPQCFGGARDEMGRNRGNIAAIGCTQLDPLYAGISKDAEVKGDDVEEDEFRDQEEETANGGLTNLNAENTIRTMTSEASRNPQHFDRENVAISKSDLVALSNEARKNQGAYETEINFGPESYLKEFYDDCKKHPDHKNFIPVNKFSIRHLPRGYRIAEIFQLLTNLCFLTLRLQVSEVSKSRPPEFNGEAYPSYTRESELKIPYARFGTGRIISVTRKHKKDSNCFCYDCATSTLPQKTWWSVEVATARHVVFDHLEAKHTICSLCFDEQRCKCVDFHVDSVTVSDISADWAILRFVTHNGPIVHEIKENLKNYTRLCRELNEASLKSKKKPKLVAIVSHPHGCCKHITTGLWTSKDHQGGVDSRLFYTTNTCTGSSGAPVYVLGQEGRLGWYSHIHSGTKIRDSKRSREKNTKESINFSRMVGPFNYQS